MASAATSAWRTVAGIGRGGDRPVHVEATVGSAVVTPPVEPAPAEASDDVADVLAAYRAGMSRTEARRRIVATLAAKLVDNEQLRRTRESQAEDVSEEPEPDSAIVALTEQQIGESVRLMLEATPSLLDEQSLGDLRTILEAERSP